MMQDQVQLPCELPVDPRDKCLDRPNGIVRDKLVLQQRLLRQCPHRTPQRRLRPLRLRPELLFQQGGKVAACGHRPLCIRSSRRPAGGSRCLAHGGTLPVHAFDEWYRPALVAPRSGGVATAAQTPLRHHVLPTGGPSDASVLSHAGSFSIFAISSSAPALPSILVSSSTSWVRASSSWRSASILRTSAPGAKSSMLSKVMSTPRSPA